MFLNRFNLWFISKKRPRPNFHSICKPDVQCGINDTFITDFTCTNDSKWLTSNAIQSFFSGHSSLGN